MRLHCPVCGTRDRREFYYKGSAVALDRPAADAGADAWNDYLHNRENPAGRTRELWCHSMGCGAWIVVDRDTTTHMMFSSRLAGPATGRAGDDDAA